MFWCFRFIPFVASANSRKDKSLKIMSQKFVMLFLVSKTKIVTLDVAAKILIEESQDIPDHSKFKSKHLHLNPLSSTERVGFHMMFAALEIIFF